MQQKLYHFIFLACCGLTPGAARHPCSHSPTPPPQQEGVENRKNKRRKPVAWDKDSLISKRKEKKKKQNKSDVKAIGHHLP